VNRIFAEFCSTTGIAYEAAASSAHMEDEEVTLPARPAVTELAVGAAATAAAGAALFARARGASPVVTRWAVPARNVAATFRGDQLLRVDGRAHRGFAELSGFFRTRDGWVRTHANYPHHRSRLLAALELAEDADREAVAARMGELDALEVEERVRAHQGIAVAVRTPQEWAAHPQSAAVATLPLVGMDRIGPGEVPARAYRGKLRNPDRPVAGLRVLDLTRVIAGPVATRTLALLGADVLRIDDPGMPEIAAQHLDNGMGKRSTLLDLRKPEARERFDELLETADVVVTGYRPGALDAHGLAPETLAARRPGIVVATLDAWGSAGPWQAHRGFDSIVQAATGISVLTAATPAGPPMGEIAAPPTDVKPGALPAQALDHSSGYLLAAGVLVALTRQMSEGASIHVHTHLARTAQALLQLGDGPSEPPYEALDLDDCMTDRDTPSGLLRYPLPAFAPTTPTAQPYDYPSAGGVWGADAPQWLSGHANP
jgi:crotonobetainyl-CoA:carnitine CoA-transferase CaiB-like acyl-CoA transferase